MDEIQCAAFEIESMQYGSKKIKGYASTNKNCNFAKFQIIGIINL
jgi:hypothetical protein